MRAYRPQGKQPQSKQPQSKQPQDQQQNDQQALEVLLIRRSKGSSFGGAWVFPGGKVDEKDIDVKDKDVDARLRRAAQREVLEETGLVIDAEQLQSFNHWTTPVQEKRRFATQFYIGVLNDQQQVQVDEREIDAYQWLTPQQALEVHKQGELMLLPPTMISIKFLEKFKDITTLQTAMMDYQPVYIQPEIVQTQQGFCALLSGDAGYDSADPSFNSPMHRLLLNEGHWQYIREGLSDDVLPIV